MKILTLDDYLKAKFGCKVYKLAIDGGFTCPNRDGRCGVGGCIFCSSEGSGEFAEKAGDIAYQLERAKERVAHKAGKAKYIAYFQNHTNTYDKPERLRELYFKAIEKEEIVALSVATRPDCLGEDVLEVLSEVNRVKPVMAELGLQTIHQSTAEYIRRGYPLEVFDKAVADLKKRGIETVAHMIIGLPGEDRKMIIQTARYIGESGCDGIKLHLLYILSDAPIASDYLSGKFKALEMEEYIDILLSCLKSLPYGMVIHRMTGDPPKSKLIAPEWCRDKKKVLNEINRRIRSEAD
ncbi:MAG: TIGR01212 family radical SAM protein [Eubacteriaceae bacterium]|nr:TIGR01212 family radical SAM protein [Eubacteriaceae bacterium]